jgi:hypothetical protein
MSDDEYQMKQFFENQKPVCVETDEKGNCLVRAQWVLLDFSHPKKLFCEELKTNKDDKTI